MDYRIISADGHIDVTWMPGDLWIDRPPAKWQEHVPQVRPTPAGPRWCAEGKEAGVSSGLGFGFNPVEGGYSHLARFAEVDCRGPGGG